MPSMLNSSTCLILLEPTVLVWAAISVVDNAGVLSSATPAHTNLFAFMETSRNLTVLADSIAEVLILCEISFGPRRHCDSAAGACSRAALHGKPNSVCAWTFDSPTRKEVCPAKRVLV